MYGFGAIFGGVIMAMHATTHSTPRRSAIMLLGLGWQPREVFLVASVPAVCVAIGMATLARLRRSRNRLANATT
jgi:hypothetical protein